MSIPEAVMNNETIEDWYSLTGKQGENKEGMIKLILSHHVCMLLYGRFLSVRQDSPLTK